MKTSDTVPTVITDKNGKITTVHKKAEAPSKRKTIPSVPSLRKVASQKDKENILAALKTIIHPASKSTRFDESEMTEIAEKAVRSQNPAIPEAIVGMLSTELNGLDQYSLYIQLNLYRITSSSSGLIAAYENRDLFTGDTGKIEMFCELESSLRKVFKDKGEDDKSSTEHIRAHFAAKLAYPHLTFNDPGQQYERARTYMTAVQKRPELVSEMIEMVSHSKRGDLDKPLVFDVLFGVHDEIPQETQRFNTIISERGLSDMVVFMKDRGISGFEPDAVQSYFDTHGAIKEGWL